MRIINTIVSTLIHYLCELWKLANLFPTHQEYFWTSVYSIAKCSLNQVTLSILYSLVIYSSDKVLTFKSRDLSILCSTPNSVLLLNSVLTFKSRDLSVLLYIDFWHSALHISIAHYSSIYIYIFYWRIHKVKRQVLSSRPLWNFVSMQRKSLALC